MERHQAGQKETLVEVRMEMDSLEVIHRPRGSPADRCGSVKCAVALAVVMGLVILVLVAAFILYFFMFTPSCNQEAPPLSDTEKVIITSKLKKSDEKERYDIFTANKTGSYLIYGWVKLSDITGETVTLKMWRQHKREPSPHTRVIETKIVNKTEIFFFERAFLAEDTRISVFFSSAYTDSLFHAYKL